MCVCVCVIYLYDDDDLTDFLTFVCNPFNMSCCPFLLLIYFFFKVDFLLLRLSDAASSVGSRTLRR